VPGFGLRNMRDRARLLGGSLHLEARSPHGTQLVLTVPWEESR
jgi:signal transduction histidine kinase